MNISRMDHLMRSKFEASLLNVSNKWLIKLINPVVMLIALWSIIFYGIIDAFMLTRWTTLYHIIKRVLFIIKFNHSSKGWKNFNKNMNSNKNMKIELYLFIFFISSISIRLENRLILLNGVFRVLLDVKLHGWEERGKLETFEMSSYKKKCKIIK